MPETYYAEDVTSLISNGNTSGVYRYISLAMQSDYSKTKTFLGVNYLKQLESYGWKIYHNGTNFYAYKEITSVGNSTISITPFERQTADVLVVAGGGGGGGQHGGAGGAGGYIYKQQAFSKSNLSITVGNGGIGAQSAQGTIRGTNGENSLLEDIVAIGGGGGGTYSSNTTGASGGSGGGGAIGHTSGNGDNDSYNSNSQRGRRGIAVSGQGHDGGGGWHVSRGYPTGGGGGAGSAGGTRSGNDNGGAGGDGLSNSILGYTRWFAGGGGGWSHGYWAGTGGRGGGGLGIQSSTYQQYESHNGVVNSGGGGGGGGHSNNIRGGSGGSGIVAIRYLISYAAGGI